MTFSAGLHTRRRVDGVTKQTITRHLQPDHTCTDRTCRGAGYGEQSAWFPSTPQASSERLTAVEADPQLQLLVWSVPDREGADGVQQGQAHAGDLPAVQLPVPHRQPRHHHVSVADGLHLGATQDQD